MGFANGMAGDMAGVEEKQGLAKLVADLPMWAQTIISILVVVAVAAVVGYIVGKMYSSIKYPDPEKQSVISPKIKVAFICILALCCFWLYTTMMKQKDPQPQEGEGISESGDLGGAGSDNMHGNVAIALG